MTKKKHRRYSPEFKIHALKRASEDGVTDKDVCEELGYTFGTNAISVEDSTGASTTTNGKYVTIWRKQTDGSWKVVVDITNSDSLPITDPQRDQ
jgi:ketosteroid isomerase-like protein